ncbi:MAG: response regulator transcription factor [Spirosomaceae bacterium]|jgi:DNA-binding NarL/FixJ family response regulator|nr:response regulator transcription factor [Spirosomataceae bacterium]
MKTIQVAIADDQMLFRKGMISIVNSFEGIEITIEAENGKQLLQGLEAIFHKPDVVLLDLSMPQFNGVETAKVLHKNYPNIKIIVLSVYNEDLFVSHLMDLGVNAYLYKNVEPREVEEAIRTVIEKDFYFNDAFLKALKNRTNGKKPKLLIQDDIPSILTHREIEVLDLICKQHTAQEIADKLFISTRTVDGHRNNLLEKTGVRNTAGLVVFAIKNGLVDPNALL